VTRKTVTLGERITPEAIGRNWKRGALVVVLGLLVIRGIAVYCESPAAPLAHPPRATRLSTSASPA
jgi:hypothetical protein